MMTHTCPRALGRAEPCTCGGATCGGDRSRSVNTRDIAVIRAAIRRDQSFMESLNRPTLRASRARLYLALAEAVVEVIENDPWRDHGGFPRCRWCETAGAGAVHAPECPMVALDAALAAVAAVTWAEARP